MAGRGRVQSKLTCDGLPPTLCFALVEARFPNTRVSIRLRALWRGIVRGGAGGEVGEVVRRVNDATCARGALAKCARRR